MTFSWPAPKPILTREQLPYPMYGIKTAVPWDMPIDELDYLRNLRLSEIEMNDGTIRHSVSFMFKLKAMEAPVTVIINGVDTIDGTFTWTASHSGPATRQVWKYTGVLPASLTVSEKTKLLWSDVITKVTGGN